MRAELRREAARLRRERMSDAVIALRLGVRRRDVDRLLNEPVPLTWETANWAEASAVRAWLEQHIDLTRLHACGVDATTDAWFRGGTVSFWTLDRVFTKLGLHVAQLPDEVWVEHRRGKIAA